MRLGQVMCMLCVHKIRDFTIIIIFQPSKNVLHYIFILQWRQHENRVESTQKQACHKLVASLGKPSRIYLKMGLTQVGSAYP